MWHLSQFKGEDIPRARELFNRALERDPTFAAAHRGLAQAFSMEGTFASRPLLEAVRLCGEEAQKALELDPTDANAHAYRAFALGPVIN
jgi:Tfp pilus assembly protein PilF